MARLSTSDYKKILDIIDIIYSVPDANAMFRTVCDKLTDFIRIYSAVFAPTDPETGEYYFTGYEVYNAAEGAMALYLDYYGALDPFIACNWYKNMNTAGQNTEIVPGRTFKQSEFACDFLLPMNIFHILAASLVCQGDKVGTCGFHRHKKEAAFGEREKKILNIILPHMAGAVRNLRMMSPIELEKEPIGIIVFGEDGRRLYVNDAARRALKEIPPESIPDPGLSPEPVFFKNGPHAFRIRTMPFGMPFKKGGNVKIMLLEPCPPRHKFNSKLDDLGLSRREKDITALAVQGHSNREIAERLFICEQTVKDHLHHIFGKLEIRRRSELAARALGLRPS
ncbi:MAG: helix-turn-helix transcriptional regulator [Nitrospiraceae bacterium]|nr:helix-turn-helix transcriptional regulator [Nitrospiraceae bacterium]